MPILRDMFRALRRYLNAILIGFIITFVVYLFVRFDPDKIIDEHFLRFVHPHDRAGLLGEWERTLGGQLSDYEFRILTKDGEERFVRTSSRARTDTGEAVVVSGIMRDCTEQRRVRARAQAWEARFYETMDRLSLPVVELDAQGALMYWNIAAATLCGHRQEVLLRRRWIDACIVPDDRARANAILRDILIGESIAAPVMISVSGPGGGPAVPVRWTVRGFAGEGEVAAGVVLIGESPVNFGESV